jgi:hypothetical protein
MAPEAIAIYKVPRLPVNEKGAGFSLAMGCGEPAK